MSFIGFGLSDKPAGFTPGGPRPVSEAHRMGDERSGLPVRRAFTVGLGIPRG
jgi:hypothetical protein